MQTIIKKKTLVIKKLLVMLAAIVAITIVQAQPAHASLKDCQFRGTNAKDYYQCSINIFDFTVDGLTFEQPGGKGCVWTHRNAGYHFTSATSSPDLGDVHITMDRTGKHCGLNIVSVQKCQPTDSAFDRCTRAELTDAITACEAFLIAGNCKF